MVPYRGAAQAITDILGGTLDGLMGDVPTVLTQIRAGKLKALAATSTRRSDIFPEVPTFVEQGFAGTVADQWAGVLAPVRTPPAVIARLNAAFGDGARRFRYPRQAQAERGDALAVIAGGVRPLSARRDRPLRAAHPREGHQGGIAGSQAARGTRVASLHQPPIAGAVVAPERRQRLALHRLAGRGRPHPVELRVDAAHLLDDPVHDSGGTGGTECHLDQWRDDDGCHDGSPFAVRQSLD